MFTIIFAVVLVVIGLLFLWAKIGESDGVVTFVWFLVIAIALVAVRGFGSYTLQFADFSSIKQKQSEIRLFTERKDNLAVVIKTELAKYPEYEKKIVGGITPQILLQFPQLKSNETIVKTVESVVSLENDVYKLRMELIKLQANVYYREVSPWTIYVVSYEKFFGEKNPVVEANK